jgi:hypothetical protein
MDIVLIAARAAGAARFAGSLLKTNQFQSRAGAVSARTFACLDQASRVVSTAKCSATLTNWIPGSAKVHTKTKLMKKTVTQKVPVHRWIVEDLCSQCWQDTQDRHAAENETMLRMPEPNLDRNQAQLGPGIP